jgi:Rrf2 family protein
MYGIRASILIAIMSKDEFVSIKKLASELNLSAHFLTKILQQLTQKGILESYQGPKGGVKFIKKTEDIKLIEIVAAIDGYEIFEECALGLRGCGILSPCPLHDQWSVYKAELRQLFEEENLAKLAENVKEAGVRLRTLDRIDILKFDKWKKNN